MSAWLAELKYANNVPLEDLAATQLLEHLGLAKYVNSAQCNRMSTLYTPSTNGWNSGIVVLEYFTDLKNCGHDRMVVGFTTTYCEFESCSG